MKQVTSDDRRHLDGERVGLGDNWFSLCEDGQNEANQKKAYEDSFSVTTEEGKGK